MYEVNKSLSLDECLKELTKGEINKLYNSYKKIFNKELLNQQDKETIIATGILYVFTKSISTFSDKEIKELSNLLKEDKVQEVPEKLINNSFIFIKNNQVLIPIEIREVFENTDINEISKNNKLKAIEFYLKINGVLQLDKLQELLQATELNITKTELKNYLKELEIKVSKNYAYLDDFAATLDKEFNLASLKAEDGDYAIFTLDEINKVEKFQEEKDYVIQIYNNLKKHLKKKEECLRIASLIFDIVRCGCNFEENINKVLSTKKIKGSKADVDQFNELITEIYYNTPSWELNGYFQQQEELNLSEEEQKELLRYINMYTIMNGVIEIDKLLEILTTNHNFDITKEDLIEVSKILSAVNIMKDYFCLEGIDEILLNGIVEQKNKFPKYKIITNLDNFFEQYDITENKLKKLIQKYTDNKNCINEILSLIRIGGINDYTLNITLKSNKINLPENKETRMLKDLKTCQKNMRIWGLNGYTTNELLQKKL